AAHRREPREPEAQDEPADDGEHRADAAPRGTEADRREDHEHRDHPEVDESRSAARATRARDAPLEALALAPTASGSGDRVLLLAARGARRPLAQGAAAGRGGRGHVVTRRIEEGRAS